MRKFRDAILLIFIFALCTQGVFASNLLSYKIANASLAELKNMASLRGLDTTLNESALREALYKAENLKVYEKTEELTDYKLEILNADKTVSNPNGTIELSGNIKISFTSGETKKQLSCDSLILDPENKKITAFDNVVFSDPDSKDSKLGTVEADIVTFFYDSQNLIISGGTTQTNRTTSEDKKVTFYTSGSLLNYRASDGGLLFKEGFITSNQENAYSSITAKNLALLDGGDMFMTNAFLSIGRVPIIYLPVFFYPGSTLVGNPAFGFKSSMGMFLSTTWEVFGKSPQLSSDSKESSFSSLLKTEESSDLVSNGVYYEAAAEGTKLSKWEEWLKKSKSYLSFSTDIYQNKGLFTGYDTVLNTSSSLFKFESHGGMALSSDTTYDKFRYYATVKSSLDSSWGKLSLDLPLYSDPTVYKTYSNRLTSFSFDSILGLNQEFPTTNSTTYTTNTLKLTGELKLPTKLSTQYLTSLRLYDINATLTQTWIGNETNNYYISKVLLPSMRLATTGTLLKIGGSDNKTKTTSEKTEETETEKFLLSDPLLKNIYEVALSKTTINNTGYFLTLDYNISSLFSNSYTRSDSIKQFEEELNSENKISFTLSTGYNNLFNFKEIITPTYNYNNKNDDSSTKDLTLLSEFTAISEILGLEYNINQKIFREKKVNDSLVADQSLGWFTYDKNSISKHNVSLKRDISIATSTLTPQLSFVLPPLTRELLPSLTFKYDTFSLAFSWNFKGEDFKSDDITFSLGYTSPNFQLAFKALYKSGNYEETLPFFNPLSITSSATLQTKNKKYSISQALDYTYYKNSINHYFDSLKTTVKLADFSFILNAATYNSKLSLSYFSLEYNLNDKLFMFYKNRIGLAFAVNTKLYYDFNNKYNSYFSFKPSLIFKIQEFLDIKFSFGMKNDAFYKYDNVSSVFDDLLKSFDFFGKGRYQTSFTMNALEFELIHYMQDWDLNITYKADIVYENSYYQWVPSLSIFMKWKTMPDLKIDQNWKNSNNTWTSTGASSK